MSFELPAWTEPIFNVYGIPWPDVDEDAFHWVQQPLRDFGKDLVAVSDAIESAITDLEAGNPSETLGAISRYCAAIRRDFLDPIQNVCDDLAGQPCEIAYQAVIDVKVALVGLLAFEIAEDVADVVETVVTLGADVALTSAEAIAVREAIREAIAIGEAEVASQLQSMADSVLDNFVTSLINPFIDSAERTVESRLDSYLPRLVLGVAKIDEFAAKSLHLDPEKLNQAITHIWNSSQCLTQAASKLDSAIDEIFDMPDPKAPHTYGLSTSMRIALKSVVKTIKSDLVSGIENLIYNVEKHFVTLLEDFVKALVELDADARRVAAAERMAAGPEVVVLSAVSTWVGASAIVDPTSGRVNASEADRVRVVEAEDVAFAASVDADRAGASEHWPEVDSSIVGNTSVQNLDARASFIGPGLAEADKGVGLVEELKLGVGQSSPHVEMVQPLDGTVQGTGPHHGDRHSPQAGVAESSGATGVQHLQAKQSHQRPAPTAAEARSARTEDVETLSAGSGPDGPHQ